MSDALESRLNQSRFHFLSGSESDNREWNDNESEKENDVFNRTDHLELLCFVPKSRGSILNLGLESVLRKTQQSASENLNLLWFSQLPSRFRDMAIPLTTMKAIIDSIAEGGLVKNALKEHGIPASSFFAELHDTPSLLEAYARAQKARSELAVDEIVEIADNETDPQRARNRIDARKWFASKIQPSKYGERLDVNLNQTVDIGSALKEARARALPASDQLKDVEREVIELPTINQTGLTDSKSVSGPEEIEQQPESNEDQDIFS